MARHTWSARARSGAAGGSGSSARASGCAAVSARAQASAAASASASTPNVEHLAQERLVDLGLGQPVHPEPPQRPQHEERNPNRIKAAPHQSMHARRGETRHTGRIHDMSVWENSHPHGRIPQVCSCCKRAWLRVYAHGREERPDEDKGRLVVGGTRQSHVRHQQVVVADEPARAPHPSSLIPHPSSFIPRHSSLVTHH
eukprot:2410934-Rhodomonas_salina.1